MALNLIKLCVGVNDIGDLAREHAGRDIDDHVTRMFPKRRDEILNGGSLYWVIRGLIQCRQPIIGLEAVRGDDGIARCRIVYDTKFVLVHPTPRRAFQGWRYLEADDAPPDLSKAAADSTGMSPKMRRELVELGLL